MKQQYIILASLFLLIVSGCYHEDEYLPSNLGTTAVVKQLYATPDTIIADGMSFTYVFCELPIEAEDNRSSVVFTTTKGTFDNNSKTITMNATVVNDNGTNLRLAKVKLTSSTLVENANVTATAGGVTRDINVVFTNLDYDSFLSVYPTSVKVPADGASYTYIAVSQPVYLPADYSSITFTTTAGVFDNGTKTITKSAATVLVNGTYQKTVQVRLTAPTQVNTANIEAAIKGTSKTVSVNFTRAYPENISLSLGAGAISGGYGNSVQITTSLLRAVGIPSVGNDASLSVVDSTGAPRGSFINYATKSDASGFIINKFTMGNDTYKGRLTVIASTTDSTGKPLPATTQLIAL